MKTILMLVGFITLLIASSCTPQGREPGARGVQVDSTMRRNMPRQNTRPQQSSPQPQSRSGNNYRYKFPGFSAAILEGWKEDALYDYHKVSPVFSNPEGEKFIEELFDPRTCPLDLASAADTYGQLLIRQLRMETKCNYDALSQLINNRPLSQDLIIKKTPTETERTKQLLNAEVRRDTVFQ